MGVKETLKDTERRDGGGTNEQGEVTDETIDDTRYGVVYPSHSKLSDLGVPRFQGRDVFASTARSCRWRVKS
jgi:hypothetical protein